MRLFNSGELNFFSGVVSDADLLPIRPCNIGDLNVLPDAVEAGVLEVIDPVIEELMLGGSEAAWPRSGVGLPVFTRFIIISSFYK